MKSMLKAAGFLFVCMCVHIANAQDLHAVSSQPTIDFKKTGDAWPNSYIFQDPAYFTFQTSDNRQFYFATPTYNVLKMGATGVSSYVPMFIGGALTVNSGDLRVNGGKVGINVNALSSPSCPLDAYGLPYKWGNCIATANLVNSSDAYSTAPKSGLGFGYQYKSDGSLAGTAYIVAGKENTSDGDLKTNMYMIVRKDLGGTFNEGIRITSDGNVGVCNTSSPSNNFSVGNKVMISKSANPATPPAGGYVFFVASNGNLSIKNQRGTVITLMTSTQ